MGLFGNHARVGASGAGGDYEIERSLRLNSGDSPRLDRAIGSAGNTRTWTFSCWFKIGSLSTDISIFAQGDAGSQRFLLGVSNHELLFVDTTGSPDMNLTTTALLRDPSAWYHVVIQYDTTQSTDTDRCKMYLNGSIPTFKTSTYQTQNTDGYCNSTTSGMRIGANPYNTALSKFDGYLAEMHHIDGSIVPLSTFGETDAETGQWIPKKVTGVTYGTNGFYLDFSDNSGTTATTLGKDSSGNGNNFTPTNFSVASGVGNDSVTDTPTNNHVTLTPLKGYGTTYQTPTNGNLDYNLGGTTAQTFSSIAVGPSGKWYVEVTATSATSGRYCLQTPEHTAQWDQAFAVIPQSDVRVIKRGSSEIYTSITSISDGDIIGIALDCDNNTAQAYMNGTSLGAAFSLDSVAPDKIYHLMIGRNSSGGGNPDGSVNFGQRAFSHQPSTDFKAWNTANLDEPTITKPDENFVVKTYSGTGSTQTITTGIQADWVWVKRRDSSNYNILANTISGASYYLVSNESDAESSGGAQLINGLSSTGFQVGTEPAVNNSSGTYVSWNWKGGGTGSSNGDGDITATVSANASAGFSIVKYTGNGSTDQYVGHGLGVTPKLLFHKNLSATANWLVRTTVIDGSIDWAYLNTDNGFSNASAPYTNAWTSTKFSIGTDAATNNNGENYITYCFSSVEGYSKVGSYEGIGGTNGPFVYTGFSPAYVLIKNADSDSRWWVTKTAQLPGYNPVAPALFPNNENAETNESSISILSNGFKVRNNGSYTNENGSTHIYLAFAEFPFKYANAR